MYLPDDISTILDAIAHVLIERRDLYRRRGDKATAHDLYVSYLTTMDIANGLRGECTFICA